MTVGENIKRFSNALKIPPFQIWTGETPDQQIEKLKNYVTGEKGILAILKDIYGNIQLKKVQVASGDRIDYYLIGEDEDQFILYYDDIKTLYNSTKNSFPSIVDRIKESRDEQEVVKALLKLLKKRNNEPPIKLPNNIY